MIALEFLQPSARPGALGRLGQYEVEEVLGQGGCGMVLKAFDEKLHRTVAIKVLAPGLCDNPTSHRRFLREARAAAAINDAHVVACYSVNEQPLPHLVLEYIDGPTLREYIEAHGPLALEEVVRIGRQVAGGLAAAHADAVGWRTVVSPTGQAG